MKLVKHLPLLLLTMNCSAFAQMDSLWSRTFGGNGAELCYAVQQTTDGGYILGGYGLFGANNENFWLVKTDASGDELWNVNSGGAGVEYCFDVQLTSDGGYIAAGKGSRGGIPTFRLNKFNAAGSSLWIKNFGGSGGEYCYSVQETSDGGFAMAGYTSSFGAGSRDFWLVKTNSNGDSLWSRTFGGISNDDCYSVQQTSDGGYILAGYTFSFGEGYNDFWLVKTDANGDSLWSHTFGGAPNDACYSVQETSDGGFAMAGYTSSFGAGSSDFWLVKTDSNGDSLWSKTFGGISNDECNSVQQTSDGGYTLAGYTNSFGAGSYDFWLVKTDANGDSVWSRTFGGVFHDICNSVQQTSDGDYILAGETTSFGPGDGDMWLVKTTTAPPDITSISDVGNDQGRHVRLRWNRSGYDQANDVYTITGYSIYRRIDQYLDLNFNGHTQDPLLEWPPGEWEFINTVPAYGEETYAAIVPTLADSSSTGIYWSVFFIRAATPNPLVYFDSEVDSGYSVDNLAPDPTLLVADMFMEGGNLVLRWEEVTTGGGGQPEQNGIWYRVHGSTDPEFVPGPENLLTTTQILSFTLPLDQNRFYYIVLVSDDH